MCCYIRSYCLLIETGTESYICSPSPAGLVRLAGFRVAGVIRILRAWDLLVGAHGIAIAAANFDEELKRERRDQYIVEELDNLVRMALE